MGASGDRDDDEAALLDLLRIVTDEAPVMLNMIDANDRQIYANRRNIAFVGCPTEEILGHGWERFIHPDDLPWLLEEAEKAFREPRDHEVVYRMRRHDGVYRWIREVFVARFGAGGEFLGFVSSLEDVTEARAAQEELARQRDALHQSEKLAALGSLLASVAHELNNPLSIVVSHAQLLEEMAPDPKTAARAGKVRAAAERCARIVGSFLAMARRKPPVRTSTNLNAIVEAALDLLGYRLRSAGIAVQRALAPDLPSTWADADQLQQLATNLIVNAEQAMAESDRPRRLRVATRFDAGEGRLHLEIADSGPGVPAAIRPRIFEPFFTTKPLGVGTGVGLSLCHGIVAAHGGTIAVADALEGGALFTVTLPHAPGASGEAAPAAEPVNGAAQRAAPQRILVVDDEVEIAAALAEILAAAGHQVDIAANGREALEHTAGRDYDLVLSDLQMPEMDGPALYRALAARDAGWTNRIIFVTGDTLSPAAVGFLEKAGRPCIEKPFDAATVRQVVAAALAAAAPPQDQSPSGTNM